MSAPLGAVERAAQTRAITVPIANYDDNQHVANENLRLAESVGGNLPRARVSGYAVSQRHAWS